MGLKDFISKLKRKPKVVEPKKENKEKTIESIKKQIDELKLNFKQEVKMPKEEVDVDLEDEEELEDSEESEDEDLDEETAQEKEFDKKKKSESKPVKEKPTETKVTLDGLARDLQVVAQMVSQVSQRLESVEATLFRMRSA